MNLGRQTFRCSRWKKDMSSLQEATVGAIRFEVTGCWREFLSEDLRFLCGIEGEVRGNLCRGWQAELMRTQ